MKNTCEGKGAILYDSQLQSAPLDFLLQSDAILSVSKCSLVLFYVTKSYL